jgi:long-chain acyl-CoA synthetase
LPAFRNNLKFYQQAKNGGCMSFLGKTKTTFAGYFESILGRLRGHQKSDFVVSRPWLNFYDQDVPPAIFIPDITLNDILQRSLDFHKHQKAFCYYGAQFSYADLDRLVTGTAAGLLQLGLQKGDRLALLLPNTPQLIIAYWAALRIGVIVALINPLLTPREVRTLLNLVTPRAILVLDRLYPRNKTVINGAGIKHVINTSVDSFMPNMTRFVYFIKSGFAGKEKKSQSHTLSFDRLCVKDAVLPRISITFNDDAVLLFTGGVTGTPKAVLLQHKQLVANVLQTRMWMGNMHDGQEVILGALPFSHSYGLTVCHHLSIQSSSMLVLEPRFKTRRIIRLISRYKVTVFPGVPTMFRAIVNVLKEKNKTLKEIRICVSGGASLNARLKNDFDFWTNSRLLEGYGLTEASPLTHCIPVANPDKTDSIGLPCPNTDARIMDLKTGRPVQPNEIGELQVRGPQIMTGYWQDPKETELVLKDGWLCTGDIAKMDDNGYFYIVDRKKDIILSGGFNVYPREVEDVLNQHPSIEESAVVGVADDFFGQGVKAFVKFRNGRFCEESELVDFCKEQLAVYKRPAYYAFVEKLPKNFIGKIIRRQLV